MIILRDNTGTGANAPALPILSALAERANNPDPFVRVFQPLLDQLAAAAQAYGVTVAAGVWFPGAEEMETYPAILVNRPQGEAFALLHAITDLYYQQEVDSDDEIIETPFLDAEAENAASIPCLEERYIRQ